MPPSRWTDEEYRDLIDELVDRQRRSAAFAATRIRAGRWSQHAHHDEFGVPGLQRALDQLLEEATEVQREALAALISNFVSEGTFDTLVVLYEHGVAPFDAGYLGDPYRDFLDRLAGEEWWLSEGRWGSLFDEPGDQRRMVNARLTPSARLYRSRRR